jgi:hypothetical protein
MSSPHNLLASVAQERHAERYRHPHAATDGAAGAGHTAARPRAVEATRRRAGWMLIGLGLRLITGDNRVAAQRARLIGQ